MDLGRHLSPMAFIISSARRTASAIRDYSRLGFTLPGVNRSPQLGHSTRSESIRRISSGPIDVKTTLQLYSHSVSKDRMAAQGAMLEVIFGSGTDESGLRAD